MRTHFSRERTDLPDLASRHQSAKGVSRFRSLGPQSTESDDPQLLRSVSARSTRLKAPFRAISDPKAPWHGHCYIARVQNRAPMRGAMTTRRHDMWWSHHGQRVVVTPKRSSVFLPRRRTRGRRDRRRKRKLSDPSATSDVDIVGEHRSRGRFRCGTAHAFSNPPCNRSCPASKAHRPHSRSRTRILPTRRMVSPARRTRCLRDYPNSL